MNKSSLINLAIEARELSYSPYSHFAVGAAVLTKDGRTFKGANIENSAYSLCVCAERNALFNAYMNGVKKDDIVALAVVADTDKPCSPCGSCRQVMSELMNPECVVYLANLHDMDKETTVAELLPYAFSGKDLK